MEAFSGGEEPPVPGREDVRFGSLADISERIRDVRFTPERGHAERQDRRRLSAISRRWGAAVMGAVLVLPPPRSCTTTLLYERDRKFGEVNDLRWKRPRDQIADRTHAACSHHDPIAAQSLGA